MPGFHGGQVVCAGRKFPGRMPSRTSCLFFQSRQLAQQIACQSQQRVDGKSGRSSIEPHFHAARRGFETVEITRLVSGLHFVPEFAFPPPLVPVAVGMQLAKQACDKGSSSGPSPGAARDAYGRHRVLALRGHGF